MEKKLAQVKLLARPALFTPTGENPSQTDPASLPHPFTHLSARRGAEGKEVTPKSDTCFSAHPSRMGEELKHGLKRSGRELYLHPGGAPHLGLDPHLLQPLEFGEAGCECMLFPARCSPCSQRPFLTTALDWPRPKARPSVGVFPGIWRTFDRGSPGMWQEEEMGQSGPAKFSRGNE